MAQYDIYRGDAHLLLDVQADLLASLNTRVVVPLIPSRSAPIAAGGLNPVFMLEGDRHNMATQYMASMPVSALRPPVASLDSEDDQRAAQAAVDFLFDGF